ncbi:hypothetical protein N601_01240 [Rhodococcus erythropolis DN1]|nr:hypothetical protein N601_01240 [Rhodococcus erythropolis DN1]
MIKGIPAAASRSTSRGETGGVPSRGTRLPEFSLIVRITDMQ